MTWRGRCGEAARALSAECINVWSYSYSLGCGVDKGDPMCRWCGWGGACMDKIRKKGCTTVAKDGFQSIVIIKYRPVVLFPLRGV